MPTAELSWLACLSRLVCSTLLPPGWPSLPQLLRQKSRTRPWIWSLPFLHHTLSVNKSYGWCSPNPSPGRPLLPTAAAVTWSTPELSNRIFLGCQNCSNTVDTSHRFLLGTWSAPSTTEENNELYVNLLGSVEIDVFNSLLLCYFLAQAGLDLSPPPSTLASYPLAPLFTPFTPLLLLLLHKFLTPHVVTLKMLASSLFFSFF